MILDVLTLKFWVDLETDQEMLRTRNLTTPRILFKWRLGLKPRIFTYMNG